MFFEAFFVFLTWLYNIVGDRMRWNLTEIWKELGYYVHKNLKKKFILEGNNTLV